MDEGIPAKPRIAPPGNMPLEFSVAAAERVVVAAERVAAAGTRGGPPPRDVFLGGSGVVGAGYGGEDTAKAPLSKGLWLRSSFYWSPLLRERAI